MIVLLDTAKNEVVGSIEAGPRPWGIALSADGTTLYTANGPSDDISVTDVAGKQVTKKIAVGTGPWGVAVGKRSAAWCASSSRGKAGERARGEISAAVRSSPCDRDW